MFSVRHWSLSFAIYSIDKVHIGYHITFHWEEQNKILSETWIKILTDTHFQIGFERESSTPSDDIFLWKLTERLHPVPSVSEVTIIQRQRCLSCLLQTIVLPVT